MILEKLLEKTIMALRVCRQSYVSLSLLNEFTISIRDEINGTNKYVFISFDILSDCLNARMNDAPSRLHSTCLPIESVNVCSPDQSAGQTHCAVRVR